MSNDLRSNFNDDLQFMKHHRSLSGKQPGESINMQDIDMIYNESGTGKPLMQIERKYNNNQQWDGMGWQMYCHYRTVDNRFPLFLMFYQPNKSAQPTGSTEVTWNLDSGNRNYTYILLPFNTPAEDHLKKYHNACLSDNDFSNFLHLTFNKVRSTTCQPSNNRQCFAPPAWCRTHWRDLFAMKGFKL